MTNKKSNYLIDSTIFLSQYDKNQRVVSFPDIITCNNTKYIKCDLVCEIPSDLNVIKVKLRLSKNVPGGTKTSYSIIKMNGDIEEITGIEEEAGLPDDSNSTFQYIDISNLFYNSNTVDSTFYIKASDAVSSFTCYNTNAVIVVDYIVDEYYVSNKHLVTQSVGMYNSISFDPFFKTYKLYTNIINLTNGYIPLNLSLIYDKYSNGILKPFRFNYEQYLISSGNDYKYYDDIGMFHYFKSTNNSNIYFDVTKPGLILKVLNNSFEITQEGSHTLIFNIEGKLTNIRKYVDDNLYVENTIQYVNNRISSIIDDLQRVCNISYVEESSQLTKIIITKPDQNVVTLFVENNKVVRIDGLINDSSINNSNIYLYDPDTSELTRVTDPSGESCYLSYIGGSINKIFFEIQKNINDFYRLSKYEIISRFGQSTIRIYNENDVLITSNVFKYNDNGELIYTEEFYNNKLIKQNSYEKTLYTLNYNNTGVDRVINLNSMSTPYTRSISCALIRNVIFDLKKSIKINVPNFIKKQKIRIRFKILLQNIVTYNDGVQSCYLNIYNNSTSIFNKQIALNDGKIQYYEEILELQSNKNYNINVKFLFNYVSCNVVLDDIYLDVLTVSGVSDCINIDTNEETFTNLLIPYYKLKDVLYIDYQNNTIQHDLQNVHMTKLDYFLTFNSYLNRDYNNKFNHWYNDGKNVTSNVTNVYFGYIDGQKISLSDIKICTVTEQYNKIEYEELRLENNNIIKENTTFFGSNENVHTIEEYNKYGHILKEIDSRDKMRRYDYILLNNQKIINTSLESLAQTNSNSKIINQMIENYDEDSVITESKVYPFDSDLPLSSKYYYNKLTDNINKEVLTNNKEITYTYKQDNNSIDKISTNIDNIENSNQFQYTNNKLSSLNHNDCAFSYTYGSRNEITSVNVGNNQFISYEYLYDNNEKKIISTYNTGDSYTKIYNNSGNLKAIYDKNNTKKFENLYSNTCTYSFVNSSEVSSDSPDALLRRTYDDGLYTNYHYDSTDYNVDNPTINYNDNGYRLLTKIENSHYSKTIGYDNFKRISTVNTYTSDFKRKESYSYINGDKFNYDLLKSSKISYSTSNNVINNSVNVINNFDVFDRQTSRQLQKGDIYLTLNYDYYQNNNSCSTNLKKVNYNVNDIENEEIKYDSLGNISEILYSGETKISYIYDDIGRITREENKLLNRIFDYQYDEGGNIINKTIYIPQITSDNQTSYVLLNSYTYEYDSDYKDKLIKVNSDNITYSINEKTLLPSSYGQKQFTWKDNNRLNTYLETPSGRIVYYIYNTKGQLIHRRKQIDINVELLYDYIYDGELLIKEVKTIKAININDITPSYENLPIITTTNYIYNRNEVIGFVRDDVEYFYLKDVLGNIKYILDNEFNVICKYEYDAWGNHNVFENTINGYQLNTSPGFIGNINIIRYKGYFYDVETQLFYCNSRYYSPELCRWISPDSVEYLDPESINGLNLYCYCYNNPIMYKDNSGYYPEPIGLVGDIIGGFSESLGNVIWKHADKYLKNPMTIKQAQKIIRKRGLNKSARALLRDYSDDALNSFKFGNGMAKFGKVLGTTLVVIDIGSTIYGNYKSGSDTWVSESVVDVGYTLIQTGIAAACTCLIPGVGWLVGIGINLLLDYIVEETGVIDDIKSWISQYDDKIRGLLFGRGILLGR